MVALFYVMLHRCRMPRSTLAVSPVLTHGARFWGGGAGELKGRWRWGKMKGRTRVTSFTWDWLKPVRTCKAEISPREKREREERGGQRESPEKKKSTPHQSFFSSLTHLYHLHLHHSMNFLFHPFLPLLNSSSLRATSFPTCQGDENVPVIVGSWERKRKTPTYQEMWINRAWTIQIFLKAFSFHCFVLLRCRAACYHLYLSRVAINQVLELRFVTISVIRN